jgi:2-polyprenyl-3-methyl-5-hydroxy-6-metoxy-1,4-benzoquinol methylase
VSDNLDGVPITSIVSKYQAGLPGGNYLKVWSNHSLPDVMRIVRERGIRTVVVEYPDRPDFGIIHFSDERMYIRHNQAQITENEERHISRYRFALNFIPAGSTVLDAACGSGYGSVILSELATKVIGVDCSEKAYTYAIKENALPNIEYRREDLTKLSFEPGSLGAVVTLETLEHLDHATAARYLAQISTWLVPGGVVVASSPMLRYQDGKPFVTNPYHINEMPKSDLLKTVSASLPGFTVHFYHQKQQRFVPLQQENSGFCLVVARKPYA